MRCNYSTCEKPCKQKAPPLFERWSFLNSEHVFLAVFAVVFIEAVGAHLDEAVNIFVRVEVFRFKLYYRNGDVGAVVGDTLEVGQQVVKNEAVVQRADALLQAVDVV